MFTGIIEELGEICFVKSGTLSSTLTIKGKKIMSDMHIGDSIAVNGVCLTVTSFQGGTFTADVMPETMRRSSLGALKPKDLVNLERAMPANGRFGGHIVSGHIDGTGIITTYTKEDNAVWVTISTNGKVLSYVVEKGSIAIDGISLTVAYVDDQCFKVSLIPHTGDHTTLLSKKVSDIVNLECDIVGKYVEKLLSVTSDSPTPKSNISVDFLSKHGFL